MFKTIRLFTILILAVLFTLNTACQAPHEEIEAKKDSSVVEVTVDKAKLSDFTEPFTISGVIKSHRSSNLSGKILSQVVDVAVDDGSKVKAGQLLVKLDDRDTKIAMAKVESDNLTYKAQIKELNDKLQELKARIEMLFQDQKSYLAKADLAEANYNRYKSLLEKEVIAQQEFDEVKTGLELANAAVSKSQAEYNALVAQRRQLDSKAQQIQALVEKNKVEMANAIVNNSYTNIVAPFSGVVVNKSVDIGDIATPGKTLLVVEDPKNLYLQLDISDIQVQRFRVGSHVQVYVDTLPEKKNIINGIIEEIVPAADPETHTFKVKIDLQSNSAVHSGMYARVIMFMDGQNLFIPKTAVLKRGQITGVYVVDSQNRSRFKIIQTGQEIQGFIQVLSGLKESDKVVISGVNSLVDGTKVKISGEK